MDGGAPGQGRCPGLASVRAAAAQGGAGITGPAPVDRGHASRRPGPWPARVAKTVKGLFVALALVWPRSMTPTRSSRCSPSSGRRWPSRPANCMTPPSRRRSCDVAGAASRSARAPPGGSRPRSAAGRKFLHGPGIAVRIAEEDERAPREILNLADRHAPSGEFAAGRLDVGHGQLHAVHGAWRRVHDAGTQRDRAG